MKNMDISEEDMYKYYECKKNIDRCKYVGIETCEGCKYDLPLDKIEYINS